MADAPAGGSRAEEEACDGFSESDRITFEDSASGCPFTLTWYDFVHPNGALDTSSAPSAARACSSISSSSPSAADGLARSELRWAYGYRSSRTHPTFTIEARICRTASAATEESSPDSTAANATTTSSRRTVDLSSISSAILFSFFVGVYSMLSQWSCSMRIRRIQARVELSVSLARTRLPGCVQFQGGGSVDWRTRVRQQTCTADCPSGPRHSTNRATAVCACAPFEPCSTAAGSPTCGLRGER